jgi:hypothetical protein
MFQEFTVGQGAVVVAVNLQKLSLQVAHLFFFQSLVLNRVRGVDEE